MTYFNVSDSVSKNQTIEVLLGGGIAVVPTDTVYGIAALGRSVEGRKKLLDLKPRPKSKPIGFLIADSELNFEGFKLEQLVKLNPESKAAIAEHWPGAVTLVLQRTDLGQEAEIFAGADESFGKDTIGLRYPNHNWLCEVISVTGPLAVTSANVHEAPVATNLISLEPEIIESIDIICDGGDLSDIASKVIDFTTDTPKVLRH